MHAFCTDDMDTDRGNNRFVDGLSGMQFPATTGQVHWTSHGVNTYLPFFRGAVPPHLVS